MSSSSECTEVSPAEHSVCAAESNLADDAPWKKIQKNTFTRWCNEHLRRVDRVIQDLQFDLNDGLTLIALLEVLSHKRMFRRYHTRPTFRQMRLDNVSVALEFLDQENIRLVSIDSKAIVDGNMKLILGLVWTLILHYSISFPLLGDGGHDKTKKQTPELRLLGWIQEKVPELPITNFSEDWMNGKALGALVDGLAPGLCPDWESWDEVQRVDNAREAMQQADQWLGVPQVIAPEEIIDPRVDEQSIMTYLSMFPKAQLKPGAPLKPKSVSKPKACRASGRGLQSRGLRVGQAADLKVDTSKAGPGDLEVRVKGPDGSDVPVQQKEDSGDLYSIQYHPIAEGNHTIDITWAGEHILKSPFEVCVGPTPGRQMVRAWGPGLEGGMVGLSADFVVESICADPGLLGFAIEGPSQARIECDDLEDGSCDVRFWPTEPGFYAVHVICEEEDIQDSPFMSLISPNKKKCYAHKVKVFGPGVSETGFVLNCAIEFTVDTRFAGDGSLGLLAQSSDRVPVSVKVVRKENGVYTCSYKPTTLGKHTIFVSWGGVGVPGSPFRVKPARVRIDPADSKKRPKRSGKPGEGTDQNLANSTDPLYKLDLHVTSPKKLPSDATKVKAYGPGLKSGVVGTQAEFTIDTNRSGSGGLSVTVDGPRPAQMTCSDNEDGTCAVTYLPTEHGEHAIGVRFQGVHIPGSPFRADVHMPFDPSKVVVSGPGLTKATVGEPCVVNIDCALAGLGELSVEAVSERGHRAKTKVRENQDGTYTVVYVPLTAGIYTLRLKYGGKVLANFPSEVMVDPAVFTSKVKVRGSGAEGEDMGGLEGECDPAKVFANGIGLLQGVTGQSNSFTVTIRGTGAGGLAITVEGPSDAKVSCIDKQDGRYDVQYIPDMPGLYDINITCRGEHILGSPFKVPVKDPSNARNVKVSGPGGELGVCAQVPQIFTIDCSKTGEAPESVAVMTPSGIVEIVEVADNGDGTYSVAYSPSMEGAHSLVVKYADEEAFSSPVAFHVMPASDVNQLKVSGPDLQSGLCPKVPRIFTIDCSKTGEAPESVAVMTPSGKMELVDVTDNGDGTYSVAYSPSMEGAHSLVVKYADEDEFCSPIQFKVLPTNDGSKLKVSGPGLESGCCAKGPQIFTIDCSKTGDTPESVAVMTPSGKFELVEVTDNGDGTFSVAYSPYMEGAHSVMVKYADEEHFCSPFQFQVLASDSNRKVNVSVPGLESGVCAQIPQTFTIDSKTGETPESVAIMTPSGNMELVEVTDNGDGTFSVAYSPSMEGAHSVMVKYADEEDFSSLSDFQVLPTNDTNKLKVSGPGLQSGHCAKVPQIFTIDCSKTGEAPESVAVMTPSGKMELVEVTNNGDGTYSVAYSPSIEGAHSLVVKYADEDEFCSPHKFHVLPTNEANKLKVSGPGLQSGLCGKVPQIFTIDCSKTGEAPESVVVMRPNGKMELVEVTDNGDGTYSVAYSPSMEGAHSLVVKYADEDEFCSPFQFQVLSSDSSRKVNVSVPGLESGVCAQIPQTFTIDSKTGETPESVAIMTPSGIMDLVEVTDNGDGTFSVPYSPSMEGAHSVMVKYADEEDFSSLSDFQVLPTNDTNKLKVSGPGLQSGHCAKVPQIFTIDCSKTGEAPESVAVMTPSGKMDLVEVTHNGDGTFSVAYSPSIEGAHSLVVRYADEDEFCCPYNFLVLPTNDTNKLKVSGPGLQSGHCVKVPQIFTVDCSKTGEVPESVAVMTPNGKMDVMEVTDNGDGTYSVAYSPSMEGAHSLVVKYADEDEFCSPFQFQVLPSDSNRKVNVSVPGLESGVCAQIPQTFTIDSKTGETPESVAVMTPSGEMELVEVTDNGDGTFSVAYSPSIEGTHSVMVKYADEDEFCSLSNFQVLPTNDTNKLKVSGPGLQSGLCAKVPQIFTIDCSKTGEAPESVAVMTPSGKMELVEVTDNGDGTFSVAYSPSMEGAHSLVVKYADEDAFCSPFQFQVLPSDSNRKVDVSVPGLESGVCAQIPQTFTIDSKTGETPESVAIMTPSGIMDLVEVTYNGDGTFSVAYSPSMEGAHSVMVKYADEEDFSCLTDFQVLPTNDTNKLKVSGPGLQSGHCAKVPQIFTIDCSKTGEAPESVAVMTPSGKMEVVEVTDNEDGTYSVAYSPSIEGAHSLVVKYADEDEFCTPFQFEVLPSDSNRKVNVSVPGLESGVCAQIPQTFTIDSKTGETPESVAIMTPSGKMDLVEVTDNGDGTFLVAYSPSMEGAHSVMVKYADEEDFSSLSDFQVLPTNDTNKLKISGPGLQSGLCAKVPQIFTIDCSKTGETPESVAVRTPSGKMDVVDVTDNGDGTYSVAYSPSIEGAHSLVVKYADGDEFCSPHNFQVLPTNDANKLKVSGPGLQSGLCAKVPQIFTIDCSKTGEAPESVTVMTPNGKMELVEVTDNGDGTYSVAYSPSIEGAHSLVVKYTDEDEFCSPFQFQVLPSDSSRKVNVSVPGLESGVCAQIPQTFTIDSKTGETPESVAVMTPSGEMELVEVTDNGDGTFSVAYSPSIEGTHSVMVKYADEDEFCSLSNFQVLPTNDANKLKVSGPGLQSGHCAKVPQIFTIDCSKTGEAPESVAVRTPGGKMEVVDVTDNGDGTYSVAYAPSIEGAHSLVVKYADEDEFCTPFQFQVLPSDSNRKVNVSVPGLESGVCAQIPQTFTIDSKTGDTPESVAIMTPSGNMEIVEVTDNGDGTFSVAYSPSMEGAHSVMVKYADEEDFSSLSDFQVLPTNDTSKLKVSGPGLQSGLCAKVPQIFTIDSKTGEAPDSVAVMTPSGKMEVVEVTDNGDGTYSVAYSPSMEGAHSLVVKYADEDEFCSPYNFQVLPTNETNKLKVSGPGLQSGLCSKVPQIFTIDSSKTGEAPESVTVMSPNGKMELMEVTDNGDGSYSVAFSPSIEGAHSLVVKYADEDEFCSPFQFQVLPSDSSIKVNVSVPGLESGVCAQIPQTFTIDSKTGETPESVAVMTPSGKMDLVAVTDNGDGTFSVAYSPSMEGAHSVMVKYADEEDFSSLSDFQVLPTNDTNKLKVSGPGLQSGLCAKVPQIFTIDCSKTGETPESVAVMTPSGKMDLVAVTDNGDGTFSVAYSPSMEGAHSVMVKYADEEDFSSLSDFQVLPTNDTNKLKVSGPGLQSGLCAKVPQIFTIDCSKTGEAPESVAVMTPSGKMEVVDVTDNGDGTFSVAYCPSIEGAHSLVVKYTDEDEFCSPFQFQVLPSDSSRKVNVSVPDLKSGVCAQIPQTFTIDSKTGETPESVAIMTPSGKMEFVEVTDNGDGTFSVAYAPSMEGAHSVMVKYADEEDFSSLSDFQVLPTNDTNKLKVSGPGLQSGHCAKVPQIFTIDCSKTGEAPESVAVMTPLGKMEVVEVTDNGDGTFSVAYSPSIEGAHSLVVKYADEDEFCSPFGFQVLPTNDTNKLKVSGPGLQSGHCAKVPQIFTIDSSKTGEAPESVTVMTPNGKMELMEVTDNGDGTYSVAYSPSMEGAHSLVVKYSDEDEFCSPFQFQVLSSDSSRKVNVSVPGLESGVCAQIPQTFTIDSKTGDTPESVAIMTPSGKMELVEVTDNGDGTFSVPYSPSTEGAHSVMVKYADEDDFSSLSDFQVLPTNDTNKLKVSGPGLQSGLCAKVPQIFTIDCSKTGEAPESVAVRTPSGKLELVEVTDNGDGTFSVAYSPSIEGAHSLVVKYVDEDEFCSPFGFQVLPTNDTNKLNVSGPGLQSGHCAKVPQIFTVDCSKTGEVPESVAVMTPNGKMELMEVTYNGDGTYSVAYSPSIEGAHSLVVKYADEDAFCSPFQFQVLPTGSNRKVNVSVPGLESGVCAQVPQTFTIDSKTGETPESVAIMTPSGKMELVEVTDNGDGTFSVAYSPSMEGAHSVMVKYSDEEDFSNLSDFQVLPTNDTNKLKVSGPGLQSGHCAKVPQIFTIDSSKTGEAPESVAVMTPSGKMELVQVTDNEDGTYSVAYSPSIEGAHSLVVKYADEDEFCSPFQFQVLPSDSNRKVNVSVPGLESGVCAQIPQTFTIDSKAGETPESVAIMTPSGKVELVEVTDNGDGTFSVAYCPSMEGAHSVMVQYADEDEFSIYSDFQVLPTNDTNKLKVSGPGLQSGHCAKAPQIFTIDSSKTGEVPESVAVMTPSGKMEVVEVTDNGDGTYSVAYSPSIEGAHSLVVKYGDEDEFCSPFQFQVLPSDSSRKVNVSVPGLESGVCAQVPQTFTIDSKTGETPESVAIMTPSGIMDLVEVTDNGDGTFSVAYSPSMEGAHSVMVKYADEEDFSSLSDFQVLPTNDTNKLKVCGPGLQSGLCAKVPQIFTIDSSKTGEAPESVAVMTPNGKMELVEVAYNEDGTYSVAYSPSMEGAHSLVVKYADEDEFCSPYNFHIVPTNDAITSKDSDPGPYSRLCAKVSQSFTIDSSRTGEAPESVAIVMPNGKLELVDVTDNGDGTYSVAYCPSMEGAHSLVVKYADEDEFCSPFQFHVQSRHDASKVQASGPGLTSGLPASLPAQFIVDASHAGEGELSVGIIDPESRDRRASIHDNQDGTFEVSYIPDKAGGYRITIRYGGDEIPASPYHVWAVATGDADKCIVTGPGLGSVIGAGEEIGFVVNTQSAGTGRVSCFVLTPDGTEVEADVVEREDGTFEICYTASQPGNYIISAGFGGESLFTSPFEVTAPDHDLDLGRGRQQSDFRQKSRDELQPLMRHGSYIPLSNANTTGLMPLDIVMASGLPEGEIIAEVHMPSGSRAQAEVVTNRDGTVSLMYDPTEEGLHLMHITINGTTILESPLQFYVNNASNSDLMAHGPGLVYGTSNEIAAFSIFNKDLALGEVDIALEGPSKAEIRCLHNRDGSCTVTYLPTAPGDYNILVRHNEDHITGSPFTAKIAATGACAGAGRNHSNPRSQVRLGTVADFMLDISEEDISLLTAGITSPSGRGVSCLLKRQPDSHIGISFIPKEVGEHLVSVMKDGQHVANSPIPLNITALEIGDASRVKVFGPGLATGRTWEMADFMVDTREAGYGGLTLSIEGPSNVEIQTEELEDGTCGVSFCPTEPGAYTVSVKFADEHVPGSPFRAEVSESGHVRESVTHYQGPATIASVGNVCGINLKIPGLESQHISAQVSGPSGSLEEATVSTAGSDIYTVSFVPSETGVHAVGVLYRGQPIPGSPYQYTVGLLGEGGPGKVKVWGGGLQSAEASIPADFSIWAREAGAGNLSVTVEGPGRAELVFEDREDGSCGISYTAQEPGDYEVSVKFDDQHVQDSPFLVPVYGPADDILGQTKITGLQMKKLTSEASSLWSSFLSDASKVVSRGPGLEKAFIGRRNTFSVDCSTAGTNLLLVGMHGPTIPCEEVSIKHLGSNRYEVSYMVNESGSYVLAIKWGEEHVTGSPFLVVVS